MTNPLVLLCQSFLNRIPASDRDNISHSIPLPDRNPYKERVSSDSMTAAPQGLAIASLHPLPLLQKQATALAQHNESVAKLPDQESLSLRILSTIGWLAGATAILAGCSSNSVSSDSPTSSSRVSSFSSQDINNYASAVIAIEQSRRAAYKDIQGIMNNEKVPDITCTQEDTIKGVEQSIQDIAVKYCKKAQQLVRTQSLTISRFNDITLSAESDPALRKQIQNELLRIQ